MTTMTEPQVEAQQPPKGPSRLTSMLQFEITTKKVKRKDLMHFSRQLAVFVKAGIPLLDALDSIMEEMSSKTLRAIVSDVSADLRGGSTFSDALAKHEEALPGYYVGMVRTAELTGTLDDVLVKLSSYIERDVEARQKLVSALIYPAIIAVMAIVVVVVLTTYVLPRFVTFFKSLNAKLPLPTRILINVSSFIHDRWYIFAGIFVLVMAGILWMLATDSGKRFRDRAVLKLPVVGEVARYAILERFCRILSSMLAAGVTLPEAMRVSRDATHNTVFQQGLDTAQEGMLRGEGLAGPLASTGLFPAAARQMFRVGEHTGTLDQQLELAAEHYDRELDYKIKQFTALFEPAVIVFMGVVVGFVAIALVSAMYGIYHQVHI